MHPKYWKQCRNHMLRKPAEEGESGGGASEALDTDSAAAALDALMGGAEEGSDTESAADDSPEAAAERLAKQELSGNEEASEEAAEEQTFTVVIDGKEVSLTAAEIAENHKNGLRQADYTRKTMEAAEARKSADAEAAKAKSERDKYAKELSVYAISTDAQLKMLEAELTEELLDIDPHEFMRKKHTLEQGQAKLAQARGELTQLTEQQKAEQDAAYQSHIADQQAKLLAKMPGWKDPAKVQADVAAMKAYLTTLEFAPEEQQFPDHRMVILAHKAMQFDKLMADAKGAVKKVSALPTKVERPGAPVQGDRRTEVFKRMGKSSSVDDAAAAYAALFNS